jgi:hypothetical protein
MIMLLQPSLDPGLAGLVGTFIGAGASITVQIIAACITERREASSYRRTLRKELIESVLDTYEYVLNVIFNMQRDGMGDRNTQGKVFAQISLRSSPLIKKLINEFWELPQNERKSFNIDMLIEAMEQHITQLKEES